MEKNHITSDNMSRWSSFDAENRDWITEGD